MYWRIVPPIGTRPFRSPFTSRHWSCSKLRRQCTNRQQFTEIVPIVPIKHTDVITLQPHKLLYYFGFYFGLLSATNIDGRYSSCWQVRNWTYDLDVIHSFHLFYFAICKYRHAHQQQAHGMTTRQTSRSGLFTPPIRQVCLVSTQFRWVLSCPHRRCEHNNIEQVCPK